MSSVKNIWKMLNIIVSGYSSILHTFTFDSQNGNIGEVQPLDVDGNDAANITFSVFDKRTGSIYGVHEEKDGTVSRWKRDQKGKWERKEVFPSGGSSPAHVAIDYDRGLLYVTNYGGGSLSVFKLDPENDGAITFPPIYQEVIQGGSKVDPDRQEASHLHGTFLYREFAYVIDLGSDKIFHYKVVDGEGSNNKKRLNVTKANPSATALTPGSGPRHMAIDSARRRAYVLNELMTTITTLTIDQKDGSLKEMDVTQLDLKGAAKQYGAAIELHPDGKYLYTSSRGDGALLAFEVGDGKPVLRQIQSISTGGTWPRHFAITSDGNYLLVADQFKNSVVSFKIDKGTGMLEKDKEVECGDKPSMVLLVELE